MAIKSDIYSYLYGGAPAARRYAPASLQPISTTFIVALMQNGKPRPATNPVVHDTAEDARKESQRLAGEHPGRTFAVFKMISESRLPKQPIETKNYI